MSNFRVTPSRRLKRAASLATNLSRFLGVPLRRIWSLATRLLIRNRLWIWNLSLADLRSATYRLRLHPHRRQANLNREWTRNKTTTAAPKFSGVKWMQIKAWQAQK